jgi:hypothetical protein
MKKAVLPALTIVPYSGRLIYIGDYSPWDERRNHVGLLVLLLSGERGLTALQMAV